MARNPDPQRQPPSEPQRSHSATSSSTLSPSSNSKRSHPTSDVWLPPKSRVTHNSRFAYSDEHYRPNRDRSRSPSRSSARSTSILDEASSRAAHQARGPPLPRDWRQNNSWTKAEDDAILHGVALYGTSWTRVTNYFASKTSHNENGRSLSSLRNRYYAHLVDKGTKAKRATPRGQQQQGELSAAARADRSSPGLSSPSSSFDTPPVPKPTTQPGKVWTSNEEAQLLRIASQYQDEVCVLTHVGAVYREFCAIFPTSSWSCAAVHDKYRQMLESTSAAEEEQQLEEGEINEGKEERGKGMREIGETAIEQGDGAELTNTEEEVAAQENSLHATPQEHAAAGEPEDEGTSLVQEAEASMLHLSAGSSTIQSQATSQPQGQPEDARPALPHASPSPATPTSTAAAPAAAPAAPVQANPPAEQQHVSLPTSLIDFDYEVTHLDSGFRFERMPRSCEVSILAPTRYRLRHLSTEQAAAPDYRPDARAPFVFHVMDDASIQALALPAGAKTHVVVVPVAAGVGEGGQEQLESGGGFEVETRYSAEGFEVLFVAPL